jgi:molecular chaperone DnaJ
VAQHGFGGMFRMVSTCPHCRGRGTVIRDKCPDCRGRGRVTLKRRITVPLPAGIQDGQAVRVGGEGEPPPPEHNPAGDGPRGDLHVVVRVREHDRFDRDGDHLVMVLPVAFTQVALGTTLQVETLEGTATVEVPAGTQHGAVIRLAGQGLPNLRSGRRGDLVLVTQLVVPRKLSESQRQLLQEYARSEQLDVGLERPSLWEKIKDVIGGGRHEEPDDRAEST